MGLLKDILRLNEDVVVKKLHKIAPMLEIFTINFYVILKCRLAACCKRVGAFRV